MATKIKRILDAVPPGSLLFGSWLTTHGMDAKSQYDYTQNGWLERVSKGVYKLAGSNPTLYAAISSYNTQLGKECTLGAFSALELRGYSHYVPMGKPQAYLFTDNVHQLPRWLKEADWDMDIRYTTTSFLGDDLLGVEHQPVDGFDLLVSSPERAILECLNLTGAENTLLDTYYIMESLTTLRPKLVQSLLETCRSIKVRRLFLYMAQKASHPWYKALDRSAISLGSGRYMISPTGRYINSYNMTIPTELADYE